VRGPAAAPSPPAAARCAQGERLRKGLMDLGPWAPARGAGGGASAGLDREGRRRNGC